MVGPGIARVLAGRPLDDHWRQVGVDLWWELASAGGREH
jgi:hypothetical protein